jgi:SusD family.
MKKYLLYGMFALVSLNWGCNDNSFINQDPTSILLEDQVWTSPKMVEVVLSDLYTRYPEYQNLTNWWEFTNFTEAYPSAFGDYWRVETQNLYGYDSWSEWDYGYIRLLNLFIQKAGVADKLNDDQKAQYAAEARFLRCASYFEKVKRMGGVPLITEPLEYDFSGDPSYLRHPRAKESEVYDFILSELDDIKGQLPDNSSVKSRATKGAALAMESRVALYAASIAKYNPIRTPNVKCTPDNGEVGMSGVDPTKYYQKSLAAAEELIAGGKYDLYKKKMTIDASENFAALFLDKTNNPEAIFVKDYKTPKLIHAWTWMNQPRTSAEEATGGRLNPSLNLVQLFEKLDGTAAPFTAVDGSGNPVYYTNQQDIFAGRDARLAGTILLPGMKFKGKALDILGGVQMSDGMHKSGTFGKIETINGVDVEVTGVDGPAADAEFGTQTGFFVRKYLDPTVGSGTIGTQSDVWWIRFRFGEVLLNAAESAFELGKKEVAAGYLNRLRERAGFAANSLSASDITFDRIVNERRVELAFEGHELWDLKRWRIAHLVLNGQTLASLTATPGKADEANGNIFGLIPYKVYKPGDANNGKYFYQQEKPLRVKTAHNFRLGNYYSTISDGIRNNNPLITKNPNQ